MSHYYAHKCICSKVVACIKHTSAACYIDCPCGQSILPAQRHIHPIIHTQAGAVRGYLAIRERLELAYDAADVSDELAVKADNMAYFRLLANGCTSDVVQSLLDSLDNYDTGIYTTIVTSLEQLLGVIEEQAEGDDETPARANDTPEAAFSDDDNAHASDGPDPIDPRDMLAFYQFTLDWFGKPPEEMRELMKGPVFQAKAVQALPKPRTLQLNGLPDSHFNWQQWRNRPRHTFVINGRAFARERQHEQAR